MSFEQFPNPFISSCAACTRTGMCQIPWKKQIRMYRCAGPLHFSSLPDNQWQFMQCWSAKGSESSLLYSKGPFPGVAKATAGSAGHWRTVARTLSSLLGCHPDSQSTRISPQIQSKFCQGTKIFSKDPFVWEYRRAHGGDFKNKAKYIGFWIHDKCVSAYYLLLSIYKKAGRNVVISLHIL